MINFSTSLVPGQHYQLCEHVFAGWNTNLSGILFVHNLLAQHQAHTAILSLAAWIIFGALLFGRWRWGWRGHRAVRMTLTGMGILLLAFFGWKFVLEEILHQRGM